MSDLYLDAYDAAVLRYWADLLSRHHASLRRPYATGRILREPEDESDPSTTLRAGGAKPQAQKKRPAVREDDRA